MKPLTLCLLFLPLVLRSEWIEPPARSAKGYLVPTLIIRPSFLGITEPIAGMASSGGTGSAT